MAGAASACVAVSVSSEKEKVARTVSFSVPATMTVSATLKVLPLSSLSGVR